MAVAGRCAACSGLIILSPDPENHDCPAALRAEIATLKGRLGAAMWRRANIDGHDGKSVLAFPALAFVLPLGDGTWSWIPNTPDSERQGFYGTEAEAKAAAAEALCVEVENG